MFTKLLAILQSKVALAAVGVVLVTGTGAAAVAADHGKVPFTAITLIQSDHTSNGTPDTTSGSPASQGNHVAMEGILKGYDSTAGTISVLAEHGTTPTTFTVNSSTQVNGAHATALTDLSSAVGHKVQIQATKQADGTFVANKVTVEANEPQPTETVDSKETHDTPTSTPSQGESSGRHEVSGKVSMTNGTSFTIVTDNGKSITVNVTGATQFSGSLHSMADVKSGMRLQIYGTTQADGSVTAQAIRIDTGD